MVRAIVVLSSGEGVNGTVHLSQEGDDPTTLTGILSDLKPGLHGFHVHALGDTTNGCMSTGPHFNPSGKEHVAPDDEAPSLSPSLTNRFHFQDHIPLLEEL